MLIATWILAAATAILALSVPVAWFTWLSSRRREREQEARDRVLRDAADRFLTREDASDKFVAKDDASQKLATKDFVIGAVAAVGVVGIVAWNFLKAGGNGSAPPGTAL